MPHRRVPLARLQQLVPGSGNLVKAVFNYVNFHRLDGDSWEESLEIARTAFPLALTVNPRGFALDADLAYFDATTAEQLADLICESIDVMLAIPPRKFSDP
jgi:hypothetical protein